MRSTRSGFAQDAAADVVLELDEEDELELESDLAEPESYLAESLDEPLLEPLDDLADEEPDPESDRESVR